MKPETVRIFLLISAVQHTCEFFSGTSSIGELRPTLVRDVDNANQAQWADEMRSLLQNPVTLFTVVFHTVTEKWERDWEGSKGKTKEEEKKKRAVAQRLC